jgi:hypothetical protein
MNSNLTKVALILSLATFVSACNDDDDIVMFNSSPVAQSAQLTTQADIELSGKATASDADGDMLSFSVALEPQMGTLSFATDGSFTYLPNATFTGTDSFQFNVADAGFYGDTGTISITIEAQTLSFASYSRAAFAQQETDKPLVTNGRVFTQDVEMTNAYDDLLMQP